MRTISPFYFLQWLHLNILRPHHIKMKKISKRTLYVYKHIKLMVLVIVHETFFESNLFPFTVQHSCGRNHEHTGKLLHRMPKPNILKDSSPTFFRVDGHWTYTFILVWLIDQCLWPEVASVHHIFSIEHLPIALKSKDCSIWS